MKVHHQILCKDLILCLKSYLFWLDEYKTEQEYSALKNANNFEKRIRDLMPAAEEMLHDPDFDYHIR